MKHLGLIMDGNRRWAREHKFQVAFHGYNYAIDAIKTAIEFAIEKKIEYLSLFALALDNFEKRASEEKEYLWDLMIQLFGSDAFELKKHGICIKFIGDQTVFPSKVTELIKTLENDTKDLTTLHLNILFCYGGKQEIIAATKKLAEDVSNGKLNPIDITEQKFRQALWCGDIPDPELIIRTGKHSRLSNFLTFQSTFTEFCFPDCYWPDLNKKLLEECFIVYTKAQRNFGI